VNSVRGCSDDVNGETVAKGCGVGGGVTLIINGTNFGTSTGVISVVIGTPPGESIIDFPNVVCGGIAILIAHTRISCDVPSVPQGGINRPITVTVDGQPTTFTGAVSFSGPVIFDNTLVLGSFPGTPVGGVNITTTPQVVSFAGKNWGSVEANIDIKVRCPLFALSIRRLTQSALIVLYPVRRGWHWHLPHALQLSRGGHQSQH